MSQKPVIHGIDHLPTGSDPMPSPFPDDQGVLVGYGSLDLAMRDPGGLTLWYRLGESPGYPSSGQNVASAFADSALYSGSPAPGLTYTELNTDAGWSTARRPTYHVTGPSNLGDADDGAISFPVGGVGGIGGGGTASTYLGTVSVPSQPTMFGVTGHSVRSFMAWFKYAADTSYDAPIAGMWGMDSSGSVNVGWILSVDPSSGIVTFAMSGGVGVGGNSAVSPGGVSAGDWHLAICTWDGTTMKLYLDGVLAASVPNTHLPSGAIDIGGTFHIGIANYDFGVSTKTHFYKGSVDEVAFWEVVLTATQVGAIFAAQGIGTGTTWTTTHISAGSPGNPAAVQSGSAPAHQVMASDGASGTVFEYPTVGVYLNGA